MKKCAYYKSEEQAILKCPNRKCEACHWYREQSELDIKKEEKKAKKKKAVYNMLEYGFYVLVTGVPIMYISTYLVVYLPDNITKVPFYGFCIMLSLVISSIKYKLDDLEIKLKDRRK